MDAERPGIETGHGIMRVVADKKALIERNIKISRSLFQEIRTGLGTFAFFCPVVRADIPALDINAIFAQHSIEMPVYHHRVLRGNLAPAHSGLISHDKQPVLFLQPEQSINRSGQQHHITAILKMSAILNNRPVAVKKNRSVPCRAIRNSQNSSLKSSVIHKKSTSAQDHECGRKIRRADLPTALFSSIKITTKNNFFNKNIT
jgi:hypothetical protein